jgi:hypothetical protein
MKLKSLCQSSPKTTVAPGSRTISSTSGASARPVATGCGSIGPKWLAKLTWSRMDSVGF